MPKHRFAYSQIDNLTPKITFSIVAKHQVDYSLYQNIYFKIVERPTQNK